MLMCALMHINVHMHVEARTQIQVVLVKCHLPFFYNSLLYLLCEWYVRNDTHQGSLGLLGGVVHTFIIKWAPSELKVADPPASLLVLKASATICLTSVFEAGFFLAMGLQVFATMSSLKTAYVVYVLFVHYMHSQKCWCVYYIGQGNFVKFFFPATGDQTQVFRFLCWAFSRAFLSRVFFGGGHALIM